MVRPLPPTRRLSGHVRLLRTFGFVSALTGAGFLSYRLFVSNPKYHGPETDVRGKTVLVTEATTRFSRDLIYGLANRGAQLIICSKDLDACDFTRDRLLKATRVSPNRVDCRALNLANSVSVRRFAASVLSDYHKLDTIVIQSRSCVTSTVAGKRRSTADGFEELLGTNYFGLYLLTRLLWNRLSEGGGRLIVVADTQAADEAVAEASCLPGSRQIALPLDDLNFDDAEKYVPKKAYQRSQWFLTLFADELARRTAHTDGASVLLVNPLISRGTAPEFPALNINREGFSGIYDRITDFGAHLIRRRASTTALFCAIADSSVLEHTGCQRESKKDSGSVPQPSVVVRAPLYQDLRLMASSKESSDIVENSRSAGQLLWAVSEHWTRLDTNPDPLPLPKRITSSSSKSDDSGKQNAPPSPVA